MRNEANGVGSRVCSQWWAVTTRSICDLRSAAKHPGTPEEQETVESGMSWSTLDSQFDTELADYSHITVTLHSFLCESANNYCVLADRRWCQVVSVGKEQASCTVSANSEPTMYVNLCDSRLVGIYKVRWNLVKLKFLPNDTVVHKAMCHTTTFTEAWSL